MQAEERVNISKLEPPNLSGGYIWVSEEVHGLWVGGGRPASRQLGGWLGAVAGNYRQAGNAGCVIVWAVLCW